MDKHRVFNKISAYKNAGLLAFFWIAAFILPFQNPESSESSMRITIMLTPFFIMGLLAVPLAYSSKSTSDRIVYIVIPIIIFLSAIVLRVASSI